MAEPIPADLWRRCPACGALDLVPVAELAIGCRHCGVWPDGHRGRAVVVRRARRAA